MTTTIIDTPDRACSRLAPHFVFRWQDSQDANTLLYPEGLNNSASEVLKRCDGKSSVTPIDSELQSAFPGSGADVAKGARSFIHLARAKRWQRC